MTSPMPPAERVLLVAALLVFTVPAFAREPDPPGTILPIVRPGTPYMPGDATMFGTTVTNLKTTFVCPDGYIPLNIGGEYSMKFICISLSVIKDGEWK